MSLQKQIDNMLAVKRAERMKTSEQLTLGELIIKLENIPNENLPVVFDGNVYCPTYIESWRGVYSELALKYEKICDTEEQLTLESFLRMLKVTIGNELTGYKGGEFLMGKTTPVWVANYGKVDGFKNGEGSQAVVGVTCTKTEVIINTECMEN